MKTVIVALAVVLGAAACSNGGQQPAPVDAHKVLQDGANALAQLNTVNGTLKFTKGAITFQGFTLVSARTSIQLPTDSDTVYTVKEQDISISLQVVIAGGHTYLHLPFSTFQELSGSQAQALPDLAKMFDPSTGLPAMLPQGIKPVVVSTDQVDGHDAYQVKTSYTAAQVHNLLPQLTSTSPVNALIWVDVIDHYIRKAVLDGDFGDGGKEATLEVDLSGFNAPVTISSPTP